MRYRRKSTVEARRWERGASSDDLAALVAWVARDGVDVAHLVDPEEALSITTSQGTITARSGEWVVRARKGEFYVHSARVFPHIYEPADD